MKTKRHAKILEILRAEVITTQEELTRRLKEEGFMVTQATVSRDIKELRLIKLSDADGVYRYALTQNDNDMISGQFYALFSEAVHTVDYGGNIVSIRCYPGMAQAVCASMDAVQRKDIVGTLAGDDTIFCLTKSENQAVGLAAELKKVLKK